MTDRTNNSPVLLGIIMIIFAGCSPKLLIKNDFTGHEIAICTQYAPVIPDTLFREIEKTTEKFIHDYNSQGHTYRLVECHNDNVRSLYLDIMRISITDPGKQAAGVMLTTLGSITPLVMLGLGAPFVVWFAYLPKSNIQVDMHLSQDITMLDSGKTRTFVEQSGKYFGSYEVQKDLLSSAYYNRLLDEMNEIENRYKH